MGRFEARPAAFLAFTSGIVAVVRRIATAVPLTGAGVVAFFLGVIAYVTGWRTGWVELMVLAAGCLAALLLALPFVVGRIRLEVTRTIEPGRVEVGEKSLAVLSVRNSGRTPTAPRFIEDRTPGGALGVDVPALAAGATTEAVYGLPTGRRGHLSIGPAMIVKADPLGLMRREIHQADAGELWIHPRTLALQPLPVGLAKDLEGPTSDTSPAGDVAFHALREYALGDDYRRIHWLSTARTGSVMVRHYVDNRKPELSVLLDARADAYRSDTFEVAVEIGASLAVSSLSARQPISLRVGLHEVVSRRTAGGRSDVLDRLTLVKADQSIALADATVQHLRAERSTSIMVVVTGASTAEELMAVRQATRRYARLVVVRVWPTDERQRGSLPGASVLDVTSLPEFRAHWHRTVL
jgi:uncharacterized protein (DUF58 family)